MGRGEPFYCETVSYVERLNAAGVEASVDVYDADMHAFDMLMPLTRNAKEAKAAFLKHFAMATGREEYIE